MDSPDGARDYVGVRKGLAGGQSLGELEAQILDIVWDLEAPVATAQVFKIMYAKRELSYSTIMLTMAKLSRKGLLKQERTGDKKTNPFHYTPLFSRKEVAQQLLNTMTQTLMHQSLQEALDAGLMTA